MTRVASGSEGEGAKIAVLLIIERFCENGLF
jgi:hypothetical protein